MRDCKDDRVYTPENVKLEVTLEGSKSGIEKWNGIQGIHKGLV